MKKSSKNEILSISFQRNPDFDGAVMDDPGLKMELVYSVHDSVHEMVIV